MAIGLLSGQPTGRLCNMTVDSDTDSMSSAMNTPPSPLSATNGPTSQARPFIWEFVPLCDLYSVAHLILLPSSLRLMSALVPQHGETAPNGISNGQHQPRFMDILAALGLGAVSSVQNGISIFTAILPWTDGYVSRSDFLHLRLQDFPFPISKIQDCLGPLRRYKACRLPLSRSEDDLATLLESAAAVIQWGDLDSSVSILSLQRHLLDLTHELRCRLHDAPWLVPHPIARKRVALIRGRPNLTAGGPIYRAARALGLDLVIVDDQGHWLQPDTEENRMHREAFLPTDMTEDDGVVDRIVASLRRYPLPIHGVFTVSDNFFVTCARVAAALGLPSNPVSAFEISVDKHRSRLLQDSPGQTARVSSVEELDALLAAATPTFTPTYPLIVKPTKGWSSECVSKVSNPTDLAAAVRKATARHGSAAVIEPFFDGPEIDANFVLLDGEVLFSEIADEPPCDADAAGASVEATFSPEALTMPSALPEDEQRVVRETLPGLLAKAGFRTGVFHVEARVVNSRCRYRRDGGGGDGEDGILDLAPKESLGELLTNEPACKLVEINARPPGYRVSVPVRHTYGVDYFAVHMLAAVGDKERLRLAARPFAFSSSPSITTHDSSHDSGLPSRAPGAQYWSRLVYVPAPAAGVVRWRSGMSPCEELKRRRPDLRERIVVAVDYCAPGDRVAMYTDGARTYVAHLLVCSRVSRRDAIRVGEEVLREIRVDVDE
ncbi:hypothetical protein VTJ49DRAFT_3865 [Mycothermus thermophilus]|uniref:ATP-grasp domain-containing protein n=1 Tax=Humicola insolens TaxID=85995 RepID=A0ABR3VQM8_HUMIN